jgi:hypothetical protein
MALEDKRMAGAGAFRDLDGDPDSASSQLAVALRDSFEAREKSTGHALSLENCARQAASSSSTVWRLIHGRSKEPKESVVLRIHSVLSEGVAEPAYSPEEISGYVKEVLEETRHNRLERRSARAGGQPVESAADVSPVHPLQGDRQHRETQNLPPWAGLEDLRRRIDREEWSSAAAIMRHAGREVSVEETAVALGACRLAGLRDEIVGEILAHAAARPDPDFIGVLLALVDLAQDEILRELLRLRRNSNARVYRAEGPVS